jgi:hypothetical protein
MPQWGPGYLEAVQLPDPSHPLLPKRLCALAKERGGFLALAMMRRHWIIQQLRHTLCLFC